SHSTMVNR
ncbi:malate synthase A, partial [Vibrio parahaemolyticus V-223/04]